MEFNMNYWLEKFIEFLPTLALALLVLIIGWVVIGVVVRVLNRTMDKRGLEESLRKFLCSCVSIILKVMLILSVAGMFGVETTSFIAIFSALMIGVGMALNGTIGHFASGVMLLIFKPFKVGDLVTIGGSQTTGVVKAISTFNTTLTKPDNKLIYIANSNVTGNDITNITGQGVAGVDLTFGIGYDDSIDEARKVILEVGKNCKEIIDDPEQVVFVGSLGDSSVNLVTRPFCKSEDYWTVYFYMQEHVKKALDAAGIGIPYPQMDVHVNNN